MKIASRLFCLLVVSISLVACAHAATYTVNKVADTNDGMCDADCSLREAVAAANATPDSDIVAFSALFNSSQTITLSGTEIVIANNGTLTINGPGAGLLTISGNNASRILATGANVVATVDGIRFTAGNGAGALNTGRGGAIYNVGGTLTLSNSILTGNSAANGGAINNAASTGPSVPAILTIINCTLANNTSTGSGAALQNFSTSTVTMSGTTVSGNSTTATGIAGAFQANGTVSISNSTFSGNSAPTGTGGGVYYNGTSLTMNNVTIVGNSSNAGGGGLHKSTATLNANVRNTIIAGNNGAASTPDVLGPISSQGNNLIGVVGTSTGWVGSDLLNRTAFVGPLANNGGLTQTHALLSNSPAINAGQNCVVTATCAVGNPAQALANDQRGSGFPRQISTAVDIGSFESQFTFVAAAPFDFDGDGRSDASVFRPSDGVWHLSRSTAGYGGARWGISNDKLAAADYDGDGITDIAVWRESDTRFYILNSSNGTARVENFGLAMDTLTVGDWDGDGKADPSVYRSGSQGIFFYRGSLNNPSGNITYLPWGTTGDRGMRGDFDGDGKRDAAIFRPSIGRWIIRNSSNATVRFEDFGLSTDRLVPADYDGDAKTDLAVYRAGRWIIRQSSNGVVLFSDFGISTDVTVPADYDGDGRTDLAVYRDGNWFIQRSTAGFLVFGFGTATDRAVPNSEN